MKDATQTTENDSNTKINKGSNSSLKGLEEHQSNGSITMKDNEQQLINDNPLTSEVKRDNLSDANHNNPKAKRPLRKTTKKINEISDSSSSLSSLSSNSDEVVETFNGQKGSSTSHGSKVNLDSHDNKDSSLQDQKNHSLPNVLEEINKEKEKLKEMLLSANQKNEVLTVEVEELKRLNEDLKKKNTELEDNTIQELRAQLSNLTQSRDDVQKELESTREEQEKSKLSNEQLQRDTENTSLELENQRKAYNELKEQLALAKKELESKEEQSNANERQITDDLTKAHSNIMLKEQEVNELKNQLKDAREELESKENESSDIEELKEMLRDAKLKAATQVDEIEKLKSELQTAEQNIVSKSEDDANRQLKQEELDNLKSSVESQEQQLVSLKKELEIAKTEIASKENDTNEMQKLKEELESAKSKVQEQEQEIAKLADQLEMAKSEIEDKGYDGNSIDAQLREELVNAKATVRSVNQANSKLEAKLSNAQTIIETGEVEYKKSKEEIKALKDKIKWLERRRMPDKESTPKSSPRSEGSPRDDLDNKLQHESLRRSQERIRDLEQKVIQVNKEKEKLKNDYDEAVKALEAVDKVYSVREMALQQYKTDLEDANNTIKQQSTELFQNKMETDQLKKDYEQTEKDSKHQLQIQEELKEQLTRTKETASIYKTEMDEVRKEYQEQIHEVQMSQARARERGKKIQILELELKETKETLQISKNVIDEKKKNMESLQESLENEKKNCKNLENQLEEMFYLKKKLQLIEDEKARVVEKLRRTDEDLNETKVALENSSQDKKDLDKQLEDLRKDHTSLCDKSDDQKYQIQKLKSIVDSKEADVEQQLLDIIYYRDQMDDLTLQLQELWATYNADRTLGKTGKPSRRRPHSASMRRTPKAPAYQTPPSKPHTYAHRRLVNKLGEPLLNQCYINSTHKSLPTALPSATPQKAQPEGNESSPPENGNQLVDVEKSTSAKSYPRPPSGTKPRPVSSYGVRSNPPVNGEKYDDLWMYQDGGSSVNGDIDEQIVNFLVNIGDRVLIQSKVVGEELLNVSGVVRFVGKVGKKTSASPTYVGLKLDQPFGDNSGTIGGKQFFKCPPRHGKLIKMSDIHAVMHPRTQNFRRVKSATANF